MKAMFIITSSDMQTWMSEVTHPYWHLTERGVKVDFFSPKGGLVVCSPASNPFTEGSWEADDLVSKGFLSDPSLVKALETTGRIADADLDKYGAVHVAGGLGAVYDLFPNDDVATAIEHFWSKDKVVGAICHGAVALANLPDRVKGRHVTGYMVEEDEQAEAHYGIKLPVYTQTALEEAGAIFQASRPQGTRVVVDGRLVTGQNQFSASEYGLALYHEMSGHRPTSIIGN